MDREPADEGHHRLQLDRGQRAHVHDLGGHRLLRLVRLGRAADELRGRRRRRHDHVLGSQRARGASGAVLERGRLQEIGRHPDAGLRSAAHRHGAGARSHQPAQLLPLRDAER